MNSGTFHIEAQDWRYFSREKSIIHTLHLGQLPPTGVHGDTVLIDSVAPPAGSNNNFSVPPVSIPAFPGVNVTQNITFTRNTLPNIFGSVGRNKTILAQKGVVIQFAGWSAQQMEFYIIPSQAGRYYCYVEVQGDPRDVSYIGPVNPTTSPVSNATFVKCSIDRVPVGFLSTQIATQTQVISMNGHFAPWDPGKPYWSTTTYNLRTQLRCCSEGIAVIPKGNAVIFSGSFLGNAPDAQLTGYMFKIQDIP